MFGAETYSAASSTNTKPRVTTADRVSGTLRLTAATGDRPWLVVLNACESAATGDSGAQSVAVALVYDGVPAVVGMREPVVSSDAACFTRSFYSTLVATLDPVLEGTEKTLTVDWSP
jgi:hypothetical protein